MSKALLHLAERAVKDAAKIILQGFDNLAKINVHNKSENDYVSDIDLAAEQAIVNSLIKSRPNDLFVTEESDGLTIEQALQKAVTNQVIWVIDPLDGTRNFIMGYPHFAISIAGIINGKIEVAIVYNPQNDEMFTAVRGSGSYFNGRRLRVDQNTSSSLKGKIIATGFPSKQGSELNKQLSLVSNLFHKYEIADIRRTGSAALDLCYVASRRIDGYVEITIYPWDIAAGILILQEAGGFVNDLYLDQNYFILGNGILAMNNLDAAKQLSQAYVELINN